MYLAFRDAADDSMMIKYVELGLVLVRIFNERKGWFSLLNVHNLAQYISHKSLGSQEQVHGQPKYRFDSLTFQDSIESLVEDRVEHWPKGLFK